jgi:hypothetical protein
MSKAAIDRVDTVEDPMLDVARGDGQDWEKQYQYMRHLDKGISNFDFSKEKFSLKGE